MNLTALKTWMIAGAIALGGGTAAFASSDVELSAPEGIILQEGGGTIAHPGPAGEALALSEEARTFLRDEVKAVAAETLGVTVDELEAADREEKAALLEAAGLTPEDVRAAVEAAWPAIVQEAAESGLVTAEQAEILTEAGPRIGGRRGGRPGHRGHGERLGFLPEGTREAIVAEALGITVEELEAYRTDGLRMPEIIAELGLEADDVRDAIEEATVAAVEQAAADGTITDEQAERFLERLALREIAQEMREQAVLQVLGITAEELEAYKDSGLTMGELLTELGLDAETVRTDIRSAMEELVQQAIDAGEITAEQGEQILNGRGHGPRGHHGGPRSFNGGNGPNAPTNSSSDA